MGLTSLLCSGNEVLHICDTTQPQTGHLDNPHPCSCNWRHMSTPQGGWGRHDSPVVCWHRLPILAAFQKSPLKPVLSLSRLGNFALM